MGAFFSERFDPFDPDHLLDQIRTFIGHAARLMRLQANSDPYELVFSRSLSFKFPAKVLPLARNSYLSCIVHGDLNSDNIIVATDDLRPILIDYQYTGFGPVALDIALLEISARFTKVQDENYGEDEALWDKARDATVSHWEQEVLLRPLMTQIWETRPDAIARMETPALPSAASWAILSLELQTLCRKNFPQATRKEFLLTCLLMTMRMFRTTGLAESRKLRLLVWMASLGEIFHESVINQ
jgi:hypothetical protein